MLLDLIKIFFITIFTLKLNYKLLDIKQNKCMYLYFFVSIIFSILAIIIKEKIGTTISMILLILFLSLLFSNEIKKNIGYSMMITTISFGINNIIYLISISISYFFFRTLESNFYIVIMGIVIIYFIIFKMVCRIPRLKRGIRFLKENEQNEYLGLLILNISTVLIFSLAIFSNGEIDVIILRTLFIYVLILITIMFITIQKSLQLYYKQKLQEREVEEIKEELKNKDKEIEELEKENLKLSKTNHSIAHKQKSLEYELKQLLLKNEIADENRIKEKIESISKEMQKDTASIELTKTNIDEVDNMLKYMQSECVKNKIDFQLQVHGNIHHMTNKYITKSDLEILLADHIKNAIIAINHAENINKSILVRLGLIDGFYSVYIYDSGIEFEIETLINLGNKPSTTHADDGGTGMGFMNTFDTLRKSKASLIIEEYGKPTKDNFTKVIKIIFDNKKEYKISSYREKEISINANNLLAI